MIGSLFSGIDGLALGVQLVTGTPVAWHCETDKHACTVLADHWRAPNLGDICHADFAAVRSVDLLVGGFPCQDISLAGKGGGVERGKRSGLWSEFARAIRTLRPRLVFVENVSALLARGFDIVAADLAAGGYRFAWSCYRSADVGAPHRRERIFILATPDTPRRGRDERRTWSERAHAEPPGGVAGTSATVAGQTADAAGQRLQRRATGDGREAGVGPQGLASDTDGEGRQGAKQAGTRRRAGVAGPPVDDGAPGRISCGCGFTFVGTLRQPCPGCGRVRDATWTDLPTGKAIADRDRRQGLKASRTGTGEQPRNDAHRRCAGTGEVPRGDSAVGGNHRQAAAPIRRLNPDFVEWMMGFPPAWTASVKRRHRLRLLGNAVQPQVAAAAFSGLLARLEAA